MSRVHRVIRVTGGKVAWTNTSTIPDAKVKEALRFLAREVDLDRVVVHVKKAGDRRQTYGRAFPHIPSIANLDGLRRFEWRYLITVTDAEGFLSFLTTLAHEGKHIEQFRAGGRGSERPCHAFAAWVVERWCATKAIA